MFQQNQFPQIEVGTIIKASTQQYTNRQFKLLKLLGQGSEGSVYEAIPINWGLNQSKIALKFSTFVKDNAKWFYKQIIDYQNIYENQNSSNYHPSNIIRIYDSFDYFIYFVIVMEMGEIDLFQYMKQNKNTLSLQQKQQFCLQILQSIVFIHSQNLFHRDIKPENYLMVGPQVKLIDFGLIKYFNQDEKRMTQSVGTKLFQAPELIEGKSDYTMSVDVWALAFVFYEIIQGSQLLEVQESIELENLIKQHIQNQSNIFNKIDKLYISDEWKQTIKKMLNPDPNQRISAKDAQDILSKSQIGIVMNSKQNTANTPVQQQTSQMVIKQNNFNGIGIQQNVLMQQLNTLLISLQSSGIIIQLQQQKEQSIKLLSNLKDQIIKLQNQLENNPIFVLSTNSSDSSQGNQKQNQSICKKEIPPSIKQKLDEQRKMIQEIEEKSISSQEELDLNENLQKITTELQFLTQITQNFESKQLEYDSIQEKVEGLKKKQKMVMKKDILEQNLKELQDQYKNSNESQLQREIDSNQKSIAKLEQQMNTIIFLQNQKEQQLKIIDDLTQQISKLQNLEQEIMKQKEEILELKIKHEYLKQNQIEQEKNKQQINDLKSEIERLQSFLPLFQSQKEVIQGLQKELKQIQDIEENVQNNKEEMMKMKAKLRELPTEKLKLANQQRDIEKLKDELKNLETVQNNIVTLNQLIKQLIEQRNLKLEKEEEEKKLQFEKEQLEKEQKQYVSSRPYKKNS